MSACMSATGDIMVPSGNENGEGGIGWQCYLGGGGGGGGGGIGWQCYLGGGGGGLRSLVFGLGSCERRKLVARRSFPHLPTLGEREEVKSAAPSCVLWHGLVGSVMWCSHPGSARSALPSCFICSSTCGAPASKRNSNEIADSNPSLLFSISQSVCLSVCQHGSPRIELRCVD